MIKMKAIFCNHYGRTDLLQNREIENPKPKDNELLVKVYSTTINRTDCGIFWADPFIMRFFFGLFKPKNPVLGTDFAGVIEAIGQNVTSFKVGDKVWGFEDGGVHSHAEYLTINEKRAICKIPEGIDYDEAVACGEGAHYAFNFINKMNIQKGQKVMLNGATGAIGSAALQLLKYYGVNVTAVCAKKDFELIKSLGADRLIDYTSEDFTNDEDIYDFVFDAVGKSTFGKCKKLLKSGGIYLSSELGPYIQNPFLALCTKFFGKKKVIFPIPFDCKRSISFMNKLMKDGKFRGVIDRKYSYENIAEAYKYVRSGQKVGNVILVIHNRD